MVLMRIAAWHAFVTQQGLVGRVDAVHRRRGTAAIDHRPRVIYQCTASIHTDRDPIKRFHYRRSDTGDDSPQETRLKAGDWF
jgi:hypothetical protein